MYRKILLVCSIGAALVFLLYFSGSFSGKEAVPSQEATKVGFLMPLSGPYANIAEGLENTILFTGVENIEPVLADDACDGQKALSAYQQLKTQGVKIFYVACGGGIFPIEPLAKQNNDILLSSYAIDLKLRETGNHVIRFIPDTLDLFDSMSVFFGKHEDGKYALLYEQESYASLAGKIEEALGDKLLSTEVFLSDSTDIRTQVTKSLAVNPDYIIFLPVADQVAKNTFEQISATNSKVEIVGEYNLCNYPFKAGDFGLKSYCWEGRLDNQQAKHFEVAFKEKFGMENQYPYWDKVTYDIIKIIDRLVGKHGAASSEDVDKIKSDILAGVSGEIASYEFTENGKLKNGTDFLVMVEQ